MLVFVHNRFFFMLKGSPGSNSNRRKDLDNPSCHENLQPCVKILSDTFQESWILISLSKDNANAETGQTGLASDRKIHRSLNYLFMLVARYR